MYLQSVIEQMLNNRLEIYSLSELIDNITIQFFWQATLKCICPCKLFKLCKSKVVRGQIGKFLIFCYCLPKKRSLYNIIVYGLSFFTMLTQCCFLLPNDAYSIWHNAFCRVQYLYLHSLHQQSL